MREMWKGRQRWKAGCRGAVCRLMCFKIVALLLHVKIARWRSSREGDARSWRGHSPCEPVAVEFTGGGVCVCGGSGIRRSTAAVSTVIDHGVNLLATRLATNMPAYVAALSWRCPVARAVVVTKTDCVVGRADGAARW